MARFRVAHPVGWVQLVTTAVDFFALDSMPPPMIVSWWGSDFSWLIVVATDPAGGPFIALLGRDNYTPGARYPSRLEERYGQCGTGSGADL